MPIVMMINLKGGVGKTASTVALAETFAEQNYRTLVIDADHQSMTGELMVGLDRMLRAEKTRNTLHDVLLSMLSADFDQSDLASYVIPEASSMESVRENLSVLPCSFRIDDFLTSVGRSTYKNASASEVNAFLRQQFQKMNRWLRNQYDIVLIDCPPSIALQVKLFLSIADSYVIPCIPDQLSMRGSLNLVDRIRKQRRKIQPLGTLWTLYRSQTAMHREMVREPFHELPRPFETVIPNATKLAAALDLRDVSRLIQDCDEKYSAQYASTYRSLAHEVLDRCSEMGAEATRHEVVYAA